jgi:hypothetical protein
MHLPGRHQVSTVPVARRSPDRMPENYPPDRPRASHGFPDRPKRLRGGRLHACRVPQDRISQPCWPPSARQRSGSPDVPPTSESGRHQSCPDKAPSESPNLPSPMPGNGHRFPEFLCRMIDIAQTGAATSGRICRSMRLHPHRQREFAVLPKINSDPSPFGIYPLAPPLDLIARPEDCAGKVLSNRSDKRRCAASYCRTHAGRK